MELKIKNENIGDGQESFQIRMCSGFVLKITFVEIILEFLYIDMI